MTVNSLGLVGVSTPGVPVPLSTSTATMAAKIFFQVVPGLTGKTYVGVRGMNKSTLQGVVRILWPNSSGGFSENLLLESGDNTNTFRLADYVVDADVANEGLLITYWQE